MFCSAKLDIFADGNFDIILLYRISICCLTATSSGSELPPYVRHSAYLPPGGRWASAARPDEECGWAVRGLYWAGT